MNTAEMETTKRISLMTPCAECMSCGFVLKLAKPRREDAEAMENTLLDKYDYAWNKRCNGPMRKILP